MKKRNLRITLAALLVAGCLSATITQLKAPMVSDIQIVPPDPSLPDEVKALSGTWAGRWNSRWGWDGVLYVEKIDRDSAQVVHAFGEYTSPAGNCHCLPDWRRVRKARVEYSEGKATLEFMIRPYHQPLREPIPSHEVSGSVGEDAGPCYSLFFTVDKAEPSVMKGRFISGKGSQLRAEMKKID